MITMPFNDNQGSWYRVQVYRWCRDNIGIPTPMLINKFDDGGTWYTRQGEITFKREEDAVLFALRWV